jgi:hypothetical protein
MKAKTSRINRGNNIDQLVKEFGPVIGYDLARSICENMSTNLREYVYFMYISKKFTKN